MPKSKARYAANVAHAVDVLNAFKTEHGCTDCGYRKSPAALHFDHIDPETKRAELGWFDDRSRLTTHARLLRYLDHIERFCLIRCANCHAERGARERCRSPRLRSGDSGGPPINFIRFRIMFL